MEHFYIQPKYYKTFRCIGGECPESCCDNWSIDWKIEEYERLKSADCPDKLGELVKESFSFSKEKMFYSVKLCDNGRCPFHNTETGLCDIQRELGEKYLGVVCTQYPRHFIEHGDRIIRWCATSCPAVTDLLFDMNDAVETETVIARDYDRIDRSTFVSDHYEAVKKDPIKQLRMELFDFYTGMLLDESRDIETSIILTALAVKHLTAAEKNGDYNKIPQMTRDLKKQLNNPAAARSLDDLKPNYQLKFKLVNNLLVKFFGSGLSAINISALYDNGQLNIESYLKGMDNFNSAFDNKPFVLKNIIMNTFYDLNMPIGKFRRPLFENYAFFVLAAAAFKTVAASIGFSSGNIKDDFKLCVSGMSRGFSHDLPKADMIVEDMLQMGITSPAHLALIIK